MAEHPADVQIPEDRQGDGLELALGAVAKDRDQQDGGGDEGRQDGKQAVPAGQVR